MKVILIVVFALQSITGFTQVENIDSLKNAINNYKSRDTIFSRMLFDYSYKLQLTNADSALPYLYEAINLAKDLKWNTGLIKETLLLSHIQLQSNKLDSAIATAFVALKLSEEIKDPYSIINSNGQLADNYRLLGDEKNAELFGKKYLTLARSSGNDSIILRAMVLVSGIYTEYQKWEEAEKIWPQALRLCDSLNDEISKVRLLEYLGERQVALNNFRGALPYYQVVLKVWEKRKNYAAVAWIQLNMCEIFSELKNKDSARYYGFSSLKVAQEHTLKKETMNAFNALSNFFYEFKDYKNALDYHLMFDSIYNLTYTMDAARNAEKSRLQLEQEKKDIIIKTNELKKDAATSRIKNLLVAATGIFIMLAAFLLYNNWQKQKAKSKIEAAYSQLKSTQAQLIQSEKMASLGELTAGIAHEIQNPLNFVNNFSDVNKELLEELKEEADKGNIDEVKAIANDVIDNEVKINHHGKRADAIVKGMLQHSRQTSGVKKPTDINALCDEYLRLSYHGLRAKDKEFNADFKTDFDETIGKINIVPQDIGRVLLNLFNNAFYATNEKKKLANENYKPLVLVKTKKINNKIEIKVEDNGNGISQSIIEKIFQPFFTTKPTGQGTGLGLSLSYDIITKEHNGNINVESKAGEGSVFNIQIPYV